MDEASLLEPPANPRGGPARDPQSLGPNRSVKFVLALIKAEISVV